MELNIEKEKLYSELKELGIEPNQIINFQKLEDKDFIVSVITSASNLVDSNAVLQIDFSVSPKDNDSAPVIDIMVATVNERLPSGQRVQWMQQAFSKEWGPFPSVLNLQRRALDRIYPNANAQVDLPNPNERIKQKFSNLHLNYADFDKHPIDKGTIVATKVFSLPFSENDCLVVDIILNKLLTETITTYLPCLPNYNEGLMSQAQLSYGKKYILIIGILYPRFCISIQGHQKR